MLMYGGGCSTSRHSDDNGRNRTNGHARGRVATGAIKNKLAVYSYTGCDDGVDAAAVWPRVVRACACVRCVTPSPERRRAHS